MAKKIAAKEVSPRSGKTQGGRPAKGPASQQAAADRTGIPRQTISDAERHVAIADDFTFMRKWSKGDVLKAGKILEDLEPDDQECISRLLDGVPGHKGLTILKQFSRAPQSTQKKVADLHRQDSSLALTHLARQTAPAKKKGKRLEDGQWLRETARSALRRAKGYTSSGAGDSLRWLSEDARTLASMLRKGYERRDLCVAVLLQFAQKSERLIGEAVG